MGTVKAPLGRKCRTTRNSAGNQRSVCTLCALEQVYEVQTSSNLFFKMEPGFTERRLFVEVAAGRAGHERLSPTRGCCGPRRRGGLADTSFKGRKISPISAFTPTGQLEEAEFTSLPPRVIHRLSEWFDWLLARHHWTQKSCRPDPVASPQQLRLIQTEASDPEKCFHFKKTIVPHVPAPYRSRGGIKLAEERVK